MKNNTKKIRPRKVRVRKSNIENTVSSLPSFMSEDEMQHILARAIVEAEEIKEQKNKEREEAERNRWRELIGYKDYSSEKLIPRVLKTIWNYIVRTVKLCTLSNKDIYGEWVSTALLKFCLSLIFGIVSIGILFLVGFDIYRYISYCITYGYVNAIEITAKVIWTAIFLFYANIFRLVATETEKTKDKNYLLGFFAAVISLVSLVIATISTK